MWSLDFWTEGHYVEYDETTKLHMLQHDLLLCVSSMRQLKQKMVYQLSDKIGAFHAVGVQWQWCYQNLMVAHLQKQRGWRDLKFILYFSVTHKCCTELVNRTNCPLHLYC